MPEPRTCPQCFHDATVVITWDDKTAAPTVAGMEASDGQA